MGHPRDMAMPHRVSICCPACSRHAIFEFSEIVRIRRKADVARFRANPWFEYRFVEGSWAGQSWHGAAFYAGLRATGTAALRDLPEGYAADEWNHAPRPYGRHATDRGTVVCMPCGLRRKHTLAWPADAWFQIDYHGQVLWGFDRDTTTALRRFIASTARDPSGPLSFFLRHVPSVFLAASARASIVERLDRLLRA